MHRATRFEIREIHQGPNSFGLVCSQREGGTGKLPPIEIQEGDFTDAEMKQVHEVLELLEGKFAFAIDDWAAAPERTAELLVEAVDAEKRMHLAQAESARIEGEIAARILEVDALDVEIAAKREVVREPARP